MSVSKLGNLGEWGSGFHESLIISYEKFLRSKNLGEDAARSEPLNGCSFARAKRECNVATNEVRRVLDLPIF